MCDNLWQVVNGRAVGRPHLAKDHMVCIWLQNDHEDLDEIKDRLAAADYVQVVEDPYANQAVYMHTDVPAVMIQVALEVSYALAVSGAWGDLERVWGRINYMDLHWVGESCSFVFVLL